MPAEGPSQDDPVVIRPASPEDAGPYLRLIEAFARYERLEPPDQDAKVRLIEHLFSDQPKYRVLVADAGGTIVGFACFYFAYSTFLARPTFYLEDIFVLSEWRSKKIGHRMLVACAQTALAEGCARLDLSVLNWNELGLEFYRRHYAVAHREWIMHRFEGETLERLARM